MEATWQDYATWAIGAAALVAVAVWIVAARRAADGAAAAAPRAV